MLTLLVLRERNRKKNNTRAMRRRNVKSSESNEVYHGSSCNAMVAQQLDALLALVLDEDPVCQGYRMCTKHTFSIREYVSVTEDGTGTFGAEL